VGTLTGLLLAWLASGSGPSGFAAAAVHVRAEPPKILNIVRQKLKPGTARSYEALETAIVAAYQQAHVPVFWIMLQSRTDATDIVYLNVADSIEDFEAMGAGYRKAAAAHPELDKMSARLATFIERSTSTLTTRRDEIPFGRTAVDLQNLRALRLTVFEVPPGHEGRFVTAARAAANRGASWLLYEANNAPTFMLVAPLRTAARTKKAPAIPRRLHELKDSRSPIDDGVYALRPKMSHPPKGWRLR
jgi:hypothetical protein